VWDYFVDFFLVAVAAGRFAGGRRVFVTGADLLGSDFSAWVETGCVTAGFTGIGLVGAAAIRPGSVVRGSVVRGSVAFGSVGAMVTTTVETVSIGTSCGSG
jgi:hypothetical protein